MFVSLNCDLVLIINCQLGRFGIIIVHDPIFKFTLQLFFVFSKLQYFIGFFAQLSFKFLYFCIFFIIFLERATSLQTLALESIHKLSSFHFSVFCLNILHFLLHLSNLFQIFLFEFKFDFFFAFLCYNITTSLPLRRLQLLNLLLELIIFFSNLCQLMNHQIIIIFTVTLIFFIVLYFIIKNFLLVL